MTEDQPTAEVSEAKPATAEQMDRLIGLFEKMVDELGRANDIAGRIAALDEWRTGNGRHPDD